MKRIALAALALLVVAPLTGSLVAAPTTGNQTPSADTVAWMIENVKVEASFYGREFLNRDVSPRLLSSLARLPRHEFVPEAARALAYENRPVVVGHGRTLPAPYLAVLMAEMLEASPGAKVLEIGTGTGYQAALLSPLVRQVFTVEPVGALAEEARARLARLEIGNVEVRSGEGLDGWAEKGPFDAILVTLAVDEMPPRLFEQLKPGGRLVVPLAQASGSPYLTLIRKGPKGKVKGRPLPLLELNVEALPAPR
jgi:protein-L-isoaspartate(D-aspartate) O-methyltransferase